MLGTCQICGCTDDRACDVGGEPCGWIDAQRDLCSRCARELFTAPIELPGAPFVRALRAAILETTGRLLELEQLVMHLAANQGLTDGGAESVLAPSREICTP